MGDLCGITLLLILGTVHSAFGIDGLYISNSTHILFQAEGNLNSATTIPMPVYGKDDARIVGLAVDVDDSVVFWSDISFTNSGIYRGDISDGGSLVDVQKIVSDISEVNGITVDWHRNYIYWTDCGRHSIELAEYDGSKRVVLSIDGLHTPRGIAVDLEKGYLFWNDQGTNKIERSRLDGSERMDFTNGNSDVEWPNQMAVRNGYLYCVDGKTLTVKQYDVESASEKSLGSADNYGATQNTNHPFGLAVAEHYVYISIWYSTTQVVKFAISSANENKVVLNSVGIEPVFSLAYYSSGNQPAVTSDPCSSKSCDGLCLTMGSSARCSCPSFEGETLQSDGTCSEPTNLLFYVLADEGIVAFKDLDGGSTPDRNIVGRSLRPVAVAYDPVDQLVYWSDVFERTIHKARLDGSDHTIFMSSSSHSIGLVDGLAIDPVGRKLYYSNMGSVEIYDDNYSWHRIEFIGLDGTGRKTIVDNVEMPRGLYVDYTNGHLFYTDWGSQAAVVRVDLDGSNPQVIRVGGLDNPNSLTVIGTKLYVVDSHYKSRDDDLNPNYPGAAMNGKLYSVNNDGTGWTQENLEELETPFGLTSYNGKLYVSDWAEKTIYEVTPGGQATPLVSNIVDPMDLFYSTRTMVQETDQCSSQSCEEVCVVSGDTAECVCDSYNGNILSQTGDCSTPEHFILTADLNSVKLIDLSVSRLSGDEVREPQVLIEGSSYFSNFVSLAYDNVNKQLYYTDVNRKTIYRTDIEDTGSSQVFTEANSVIDGMDLSGGKLYWTSFDNGSISCTDINDNTTTLLISGLSRPRAIKVTTNDIYWTEWGQTPRVVKASKDGTGQVVLVKDSLVRPNGLDVDSQYLYIGESLDDPKFFKCNLNGSGCNEITVTSGGPPQHVYSIKKKANRIYYTDWKAGTLSLIILNEDKTAGRVVHLAEQLMRPTEIIVQTGDTDPCPNGHGCAEECLPYFGGYLCVCPKDEYLQNDGKSCETADNLTPCTYGGTSYKVGESFNPEECVSCTCELDDTYGNPMYGNAMCRVMTCPELSCNKDEQTTPAGDCCARCVELPCADTPISINNCSSGTFTKTVTLGRTQSYVEDVQLMLTSKDNCKLFREVSITYSPEQPLFAWSKDYYEVKATATAPTSGGEPDTATCDIQITVVDVTNPVVTCPSDQTLYYTEDHTCVNQPAVVDNVCGTSGQQACKLEGEICRKFNVGSTTVTYTATDYAGNEGSCSFQVIVTRANLECEAFNVMNGNVDCNSQGCTISCSDGYRAALVGDNTVYECQNDGTYSPDLPTNIEVQACAKIFKQRMILVEVLRDLFCPVYSVDIVAAGLQKVITERYITNRTLNTANLKISAKVQGSGCDGNRRKRATDDFRLNIDLSTEFEDNQDEDNVKEVLTNIMDQLRQDIIDGILLANIRQEGNEVTKDNFDRQEGVLSCESGQIYQDDVCIQCPTGTKASNGQCVLCPMNEYNDKAGSTNCKVCPGGKVTGEKGTVSRTLCVDEVDVSSTEEPVEGDGNTLIIIIVVVVVLVVVALIVIVVAVVLCKRKARKGGLGDNKPSFDNPMFKDEGVYEEPPEVISGGYEGLSVKKDAPDTNPYDHLQAPGTNGTSVDKADQDAYMEPTSLEPTSG